jgi:hypothetical protein
MKMARRIRLSTLLLVVVVLALVFGLVVQKRRERQLQATLLPYRDLVAEGVLEALDRPFALTNPDGATLEQALKDIKLRSTGQPKLPRGIPIYVDPIGLSQAAKTMQSTIKRPPPDENLTLREHLERMLKPLGLGFFARDGFLTITSDEAVDVPLNEDPYHGYRDVLR